jgi:hypothetical protein
MAIAASCFFGLLVAALVLRCKYKRSPLNLKYFCALILGLVDLSLDISFVVTCFSPLAYNNIYAANTAIGYSSLIFLAVPLAVNFGFVLHTIRSLMCVEANREKITGNLIIYSVVSLLSVLNTELLNVVRTDLLGVFNLEVPPSVGTGMQYSGLITNLLEDVPQLIIQTYMLSLTG